MLTLLAGALCLALCPFGRNEARAGAQTEGGAAFLLHSLSVSDDGEQTLLEASIGVRNAGQLQTDLKNGAALTLTLEVALKQPRFMVPDTVLNQYVRTCQLRFDPLTREYVLLSPGVPPLRQRNLTALLEAALEDVTLPLAPLGTLLPGRSYTAFLTLAVRYADVPPWLKKALFFWSWDVVSPTTFSHSFAYEPDPASRRQPELAHD